LSEAPGSILLLDRFPESGARLLDLLVSRASRALKFFLEPSGPPTVAIRRRGLETSRVVCGGNAGWPVAPRWRESTTCPFSHTWRNFRARSNAIISSSVCKPGAERRQQDSGHKYLAPTAITGEQLGPTTDFPVFLAQLHNRKIKTARETMTQGERPTIADSNMGVPSTLRTGHTCPRCGWSNTRRSQLDGAVDRTLAVFLLIPIRCRNCRNRFYRLRNPWLKYLLAIGLIGALVLMVVAIRSIVPAHPTVFSKT
jgi:hypothetical protein